MSELVSIVVPVYNVLSYFPSCIESVLSQTYSNIEVVVVDDGSTDGSSQLVDFYCEKDSRIKSYHKINGGLNSARLDGYKLSAGEWIFFVDGDDTLESDAIENLVKYSDETTDIVVGFSFDNTGNEIDIDIDTWRKTLIRSNPVYCTAWGKLYRRSIVSAGAFDLRFNPRTRGQDMPMNIKIAFATNKHVKISPYKVYNYLERNDSYSKTANWNIKALEDLYYEVKYSIPQNEQYRFIQQLIDNRLISLRKSLVNTPLTVKTYFSGSKLITELQSEMTQLSKTNPFTLLLVKNVDSFIVKVLVKFGYRLLVVREYIHRVIKSFRFK